MRKFCKSKKPDPADFDFINYVGLKDLGQKQNLHGAFSEEQLYGLRPALTKHTRFKLGYLPVIALVCGIFAIDHLQIRNYNRSLASYRFLIENQIKERNGIEPSL